MTTAATTSRTINVTLAHENLWVLVDVINKAVHSGQRVTVNGIEAHYRWGNPASGWGTGSLSVKHRARTTRGTAEAWFKTGADLRIEIAS